MGANPDKLDLDHLAGFAADLKMDVPKFRACVTSAKYKEPVQADVLEAMKIGAKVRPRSSSARAPQTEWMAN